MHYGKIISAAVRKKWHKQEEKEWWYTKFSAARRARTARLSEAQGHHCATCGCKTFLSQEDRQPDMKKWQLATLEHIKPQCRGGTDHFYNTVMTCDRCNSRRGTMNIMKFWEIMQDPEKAALFMRTQREVAAARAERKFQKKIDKQPEKMERAAFRLAVTAFMVPEFSDYMDRYIRHLEQPMAA